MRSSFVLFRLFTVVVVAGIAMAVSAGTLPVQDLTSTAPPPLRQDITPTPSAARGPQRPTVVQPGRIYEGNYAGTPVDYVLQAELGQFFVLEVTTDAFDAVLEIYDSAGVQVARDDDSGTGNMPFIIFVAPSNDTFTVTLRGFSDPVEGPYILHVGASVVSLSFGQPVDASTDGTTSTIYAFEAERGDVVNITVNSGDSVDTTLRLIGPDNVEVGYVDDYTGVDPEFRRLPLNDSGTYFLLHAPYSTSAVGDFTLSIERTELISLSADPAPFALEQGKDVFNLSVEAGELYLVTLTGTGEMSGSLEISDMDTNSRGSVSFNVAEGASLFFRAASSGIYRLTVTASGSTSPTDVFLSIRPTSQ